jgi:hypothetical protein
MSSSKELLRGYMLDFNEIAAHASNKCYCNVDEVNWSPSKEDIESH